MSWNCKCCFGCVDCERPSLSAQKNLLLTFSGIVADASNYNDVPCCNELNGQYELTPGRRFRSVDPINEDDTVTEFSIWGNATGKFLEIAEAGARPGIYWPGLSDRPPLVILRGCVWSYSGLIDDCTLVVIHNQEPPQIEHRKQHVTINASIGKARGNYTSLYPQYGGIVPPFESSSYGFVGFDDNPNCSIYDFGADNGWTEFWWAQVVMVSQNWYRSWITYGEGALTCDQLTNVGLDLTAGCQRSYPHYPYYMNLCDGSSSTCGLVMVDP